MRDWEQRLAQWRAEVDLASQLEGVRWVPLADACQEIGVSRSALRSWYRSGQIRSRLVDGPHGPQRLVVLEEVAERASRSPRIRKRAEREVSIEAQLTLLHHRFGLLEMRLAAIEDRLDT